MGKNCFCPLNHGDSHSFLAEHLVYCSLCVTVNTGLGRCVQLWPSQGVKALFNFLFTVVYLSFANLSKSPAFDSPKQKRNIQSNFIKLSKPGPTALGWGVARKKFLSYVHKAKQTPLLLACFDHMLVSRVIGRDMIGLDSHVFYLKELFQIVHVDFPLCISSYTVDLSNVYINFGAFLISR